MKYLIVFGVLAVALPRAAANPCPKVGIDGPTATITPSNSGIFRLVVRIEDPPRTRVMLSIDNEAGAHYELVWEPPPYTVLQQEVLLPADNQSWRLTPSAEYERVHAGSAVYTFGTKFFKSGQIGVNNDLIKFWAENNVSTAGQPNPVTTQGQPALIAACKPAQVDLGQLVLDKRKVVAAGKARGVLDAAAPEPVVETLSLLAEIALDRAKSGAMSLVKDKFVSPICDALVFERIGLMKAKGKLLPRTCALAQNLRLEDVLSSGRALIGAVETDIRETILPQVVAHLPGGAQETALAQLAIGLANRMVDGQLDGIVEIDFLVALFDQMSWATGFDRNVERIAAWISVVPDVKKIVVNATLPNDFDSPRLLQRGDGHLSFWSRYSECQPKEINITIGGGFRYAAANRKDCVNAVVNALPADGWLQVGIDNKLFTLSEVIAAVRGSSTLQDLFVWMKSKWTADAAAAGKTIREYVNTEVIAKLATEEPKAFHAIEAACAARLVVGIAKWCSKQESCAAGEIAAMLQNPARVFAPSQQLPWAMCWVNDTQYRLPTRLDDYLDLGVRLVAFLQPPTKGDERQRIAAMIRWVFDVVARLSTDEDGRLARVHDVIKQLLDKDYVSALTTTLTIAAEVRAKGKLPEAAKRALQLFGAVGAYVRVYEDTKSLDPSAAREARRKALEGFIDAATDRRERGRDGIVSLGSNVGLGYTITDVYNRNDPDDGGVGEIALRVPIGFSLQLLPLGSQLFPNDIYLTRYLGLHASLQLADLGQFARATANDVTWATFVSPGIELGFLFGEPDRTISLTFHGAYAPAIADSTPPVWRYGVSLGYYVPFFDFN